MTATAVSETWPWVEADTYQKILDNPFPHGSGYGAGYFYAMVRGQKSKQIFNDLKRRHPDLIPDELNWVETLHPGFLTQYGDLPRTTIHNLFPELYSFDSFIERVETVMRAWSIELVESGKRYQKTRTYQRFLARFNSPAGKLMTMYVPSARTYQMNFVARAGIAMAFEGKEHIWSQRAHWTYMRGADLVMQANLMFLATEPAFPDLHRRQKNYEEDVMAVRHAFTENGYWHPVFTANEERLR